MKQDSFEDPFAELSSPREAGFPRWIFVAIPALLVTVVIVGVVMVSAGHLPAWVTITNIEEEYAVELEEIRERLRRGAPIRWAPSVDFGPRVMAISATGHKFADLYGKHAPSGHSLILRNRLGRGSLRIAQQAQPCLLYRLDPMQGDGGRVIPAVVVWLEPPDFLRDF